MAKKFTFKLEALLTVKKKAEDEIKQQIAEKNREMEDVRQEIFDGQERLGNFQKDEKNKRKSGSEDVADMRHSVAHRDKLRRELLKAGQKLDGVMIELYGLNQKLIKASQERRAVEIIKEKQFAEWKREIAVAEQKFLDELSQQQFVRQHKRDA